MLNIADTYEEVKKFLPKTLRNSARSVSLHLLAEWYKKTNNIPELLSKNRIQFLYIHHIFRDEEDQLRELLNVLSRHHQFIGYSDAVRKIQKGTIDKPFICLSSDDGLKNNLRAGKIFQEFGISACFFICPAIIDENRIEVISEFSRRRLDFPPVEFLSWREVEELMSMGHEIGGHTMNHIMISKTLEENLDFELATCYNELVSHCGSKPHFAYPYGRFFHFNDVARKKIFEIGYLSCASAERGCHIRKSNAFLPASEILIRRDHVILTWPWEHIEYFIAKNSKNASEKSNFFPAYADSDSYQQP